MTIYGCFLIFLLRYQTSQMLVSINYCFPWSVLRFQRFWMSVKIKIFVLYRLQDWNILETIVNNNLQINRSAEFLRLWYLLHFYNQWYTCTIVCQVLTFLHWFYCTVGFKFHKLFNISIESLDVRRICNAYFTFVISANEKCSFYEVVYNGVTNLWTLTLNINDSFLSAMRYLDRWHWFIIPWPMFYCKVFSRFIPS